MRLPQILFAHRQHPALQPKHLLFDHLRQRVCTYLTYRTKADVSLGWQDDHTVVSRTDIKDRQTDSRNDRRAAGGRLKHKWSAVKLVSPAKYIAEEQARAPGQTAVDRFRALSPASQEALLQQRERQRCVISGILSVAMY